jgi:hypothetical protein
VPLPTDKYRPSVLIQVRIPGTLNDLVRDLAFFNRRSLSSTVTIILEKGLGLDPIDSLYMREEEVEED